MSAFAGSAWLDEHVLPQIRAMLLQDAYFKLMGRARDLTGKFNGPIAWLIYVGYITSQTIVIRRLCEDRRDVISLRRVLEDAKDNIAVNTQRDRLLRKLDACKAITDLVNDHIAHTANPLRRPNTSVWNLDANQITEAHKAICEVAMILARILLNRDYGEIMPVIQSGDMMEDFRLWVADADIPKLWDFWHDHRATVNSWRFSE
jgi:hypothetical protein